MHKLVPTSLSLLALVVPSLSLADWVAAGVAYACPKSHAAFELLPTVEASYPEAVRATKPGFRKLTEGTHHLHCRVGKADVKATLRVFGPSDRGQGMGEGYVEIERLTIGSFTFIDRPTPFDWALYGDPSLDSIRVYAKATRIFLTVCHLRSENSRPVRNCTTSQAEQ